MSEFLINWAEHLSYIWSSVKIHSDISITVMISKVFLFFVCLFKGKKMREKKSSIFPSDVEFPCCFSSSWGKCTQEKGLWIKWYSNRFWSMTALLKQDFPQWTEKEHSMEAVSIASNSLTAVLLCFLCSMPWFRDQSKKKKLFLRTVKKFKARIWDKLL